MKIITNLIGIIMIISGVALLGYQSYTCVQREQVAQIGTFQITAEAKKVTYYPPILGGGLCLLGGIVLLIAGRRK